MEDSERVAILRAVITLLIVILVLKVLISILIEYRWYFPPDFNSSAFLGGRRDSFFGIYRAAFYTHIIAGPISVVLATFLALSRGRPSLISMHRLVGRIQVCLVMIFVAPSGLVIAQQAYAGLTAVLGFSLLAVATFASAAATIHYARKRQFHRHQRWAIRCLVLLLSPLLLRIVSGAVIVMDVESDWIYRLNAWASWLIPLAVYELWWRLPGPPRSDLRIPVFVETN